MKRFAAAAFAVLLLWAVVPTIGELFENAVHYLLEGHTAHAAPEGHQHGPTGPEHGCTGAVHLCSCCVSLSCLPSFSATVASVQTSSDLIALPSAHASGPTGRGIYHPPRA